MSDYTSKRERLYTNLRKYKEIGILTYSNSIDELLICDVTISVLIEVVVDAGELLGCHETSELGGHLLELQLVQGARSVDVVRLLTNKKLDQ